MRTLLLLALLSVNAGAVDYSFVKRVNPGDLVTDLTAAGIAIASISCVGDSCTISGASSDPAAVVAAYSFQDRAAQMESARTQAIALAKKLKAGTITNAEKDALLLRLCFLLLSQDQ